MAATLIRISGAAAAALGASYVGRTFYGVFNKGDGMVTEDDSWISIGALPKLRKVIRIEYSEGPDGKTRYSLIDEAIYSKEVVAQIKRYEATREELKEKASRLLGESIHPAFNAMEQRVPRFADWYFSYSTSYYFASRIAMSAASSSLSLTRTKSITECISSDIEALIQQRYASIVMRPEMADPVLQRGFSDTISEIHKDYIVAVQRGEARFAQLVEQHAPQILSNPSHTLRLDWSAQACKPSHLQTTFEKSPETGLGLVITGGVLGKAAGGAVGSKAVSSSLASKLAAPFFSSSGLGGAAAGALAGPGGTVVGAGIGVTIDMLINKGTELMQRSNFVSDVEEAIKSTEKEWTISKLREVHRAIDVWIDEAEQTLQFESRHA